MEPKIKLPRAFVQIIWKQLFQSLTIREAVEQVRQELEDSGSELRFKYSEDYVSRRLQSFPCMYYKKNLMKKLAFFEKEITEELIEIVD